MKLITENLHLLKEICRKYNVKRLYVFGSILTDRFRPDSDVDFSVVFDHEKIDAGKLDWATLFFNFLDELESLLKRKVDIVFESAIRNPYFRKELDATKQLIYGG